MNGRSDSSVRSCAGGFVCDLTGLHGLCARACRRSGRLRTPMTVLLSLTVLAASPQDAHPTFTVGDATAGRGQKALGVLKVPAGIDAGYDMPVAVIHGARPGPVLAVVAGAHGSEYASIVAAEQLISCVNPAEVSGTLVVLPSVNVPAFRHILSP